MIDLPALQQAIQIGSINEESIDVVNQSCDASLEKLEWLEQDILDCLLCATTADFKGSEWCDTTWGGRLACDAYSFPYDDIKKRRLFGATEFYLKFSLDPHGKLRIQMVRIHLS